MDRKMASKEAWLALFLRLLHTIRRNHSSVPTSHQSSQTGQVSKLPFWSSWNFADQAGMLVLQLGGDGGALRDKDNVGGGGG